MITFEQILEPPVVPVVRSLEPATASTLASTLSGSGLSTIEVTVESDGGFEAISALSSGPLLVGAGTVLSVASAQTAVEAGARYLVSPDLNLDLIDWSRRQGVPYLPGVFSPTEAGQALTAGVRWVKLFPAAVGGPGLVRSLLGPYPEIRIVATGGISARNAADFLEAGAAAIGVGNWLVGHSDPREVAKRSEELLGAIATTRLS